MGSVQSHSTRVQMFPSLSSLSVGEIVSVSHKSTRHFDKPFTEKDVFDSIDKHAFDILYKYRIIDQLYSDLEKIESRKTSDLKIELLVEENARIDFISGLVTTVLTVTPLTESTYTVGCTVNSLGYNNAEIDHTFTETYDFGPLRGEAEAVKKKNKELPEDDERKIKVVFDDYYESGMFPLLKDSMETFGNYHIVTDETGPYTRWAAWAEHMHKKSPDMSDERLLESWKVMHLFRSLHRVYLQALVAVLYQPCQILAQLTLSIYEGKRARPD